MAYSGEEKEQNYERFLKSKEELIEQLRVTKQTGNRLEYVRNTRTID